ncbi:MAG: hypothetical protein HY231_23665 [Acidobacteria bacterium]|nr:hypothetical protein [Acidobacteriota bacterium]
MYQEIEEDFMPLTNGLPLARLLPVVLAGGVETVALVRREGCKIDGWETVETVSRVEVWSGDWRELPFPYLEALYPSGLEVWARLKPAIRKLAVA